LEETEFYALSVESDLTLRGNIEDAKTVRQQDSDRAADEVNPLNGALRHLWRCRDSGDEHDFLPSIG